MNENRNQQAGSDRQLLEEHAECPERFQRVVTDTSRKCPVCHSTGFPASPEGCHFCDGTEGGNPPSKDHIEAVSNLIKASKLLGGRYRVDTIHLPCGRSIRFDETSGYAKLWSVTPSWAERGPLRYFRKADSPEEVARAVRLLVVNNDREIS